MLASWREVNKAFSNVFFWTQGAIGQEHLWSVPPLSLQSPGTVSRLLVLLWPGKSHIKGPTEFAINQNIFRAWLIKISFLDSFFFLSKAQFKETSFLLFVVAFSSWRLAPYVSLYQILFVSILLRVKFMNWFLKYVIANDKRDRCSLSLQECG